MEKQKKFLIFELYGRRIFDMYFHYLKHIFQNISAI